MLSKDLLSQSVQVHGASVSCLIPRLNTRESVGADLKGSEKHEQPLTEHLLRARPQARRFDDDGARD